MKPLSLYALLCVALFGLLCGCGGSDHASVSNSSSSTSSTSGGNTPVTSTPRTYDNLEFVVSSPKTSYAIGEAIPLTVTITNLSDAPRQLVTYTNTSGRFQARQNDMLIWDSFYGGGANVAVLDLAAHESKTYSETWDQFTQGDTPHRIPAGQYQITGYYATFSIDGTMLPNGIPSSDLSGLTGSNPITISISASNTSVASP